jgi:tight adherence protein B
MTGAVLLICVVVFVEVALTLALGTNLIESRKKKKVTQMLQTAVGDAPQVSPNLLLEREGEEDAVARLLSRFNFARVLEERIQQAGMTTTVHALLFQMLIAAAVGALVGVRFHVLLYPGPSVAAMALVGGMLPYLVVKRKRSSRLAAFEEQFPEALDFLARAMRAGHAFSIALEMLSEETAPPLGQEFRKVYNEHNLGLPIETALGSLKQRVPLLDVSFFVSAVLLQRETGGNLSEILTNLAHVIRERFKLKGQVRAASAHGRITGTILTLMPVVLMFGLLVVAPGYLQSMVDDPDGRMMIVGVIIGMVLGHLTIRRIVNIKV